MADYKPLLVVLLDLAAMKKGLVLMKGKDYWRIEDAAAQARRDAASGAPITREFLHESRFFWSVAPDGKVVVMESVGGEERPFAVEPGSEIPVPR